MHGGGQPPSDLLFAIAFCKVIALIRRKLAESRLTITFQTDDARESLGIGPAASGSDMLALSDSSYADDLASALWCVPFQVRNILQKAGGILWAVYEACGFRLNWGLQKLLLLCMERR